MKTRLDFGCMCVTIVAALGSSATPALAQPLSTAFTYQGQLNQSSAPLDATADFEFRLFDAPSGGTQVGNTALINNVNVVDGLFTASVDCGSSPFNGNQRWLQIAVRSPAGSGNFTTLSPRQPMTAVPYALYALTGPGSGGPWAVNGNNVFNTNAGNVGIGTTAPTHTVHIASPEPALALQDTDSTTQQVGFISYRDSANTEQAWIGYGNAGIPLFSIVNARPGGNIALLPFTGNVGIGTETPTAKLEVNGDIRLGPSGQFRAAAGDESLRLVRGDIDGNGTIVRGAGFQVTRVFEGVYDVTFTPAFSGTPTIVAMATQVVSESRRWPYVGLPHSASVARVVIMNSQGDFTDSDWSICVIGPR